MDANNLNTSTANDILNSVALIALLVFMTVIIIMLALYLMWRRERCDTFSAALRQPGRRSVFEPRAQPNERRHPACRPAYKTSGRATRTEYTLTLPSLSWRGVVGGGWAEGKRRSSAGGVGVG
ncbi:hypothetical protein QBC45DRAFT_441534 [Copromyces sp. CBS 386.78]|nr:hypothetical protein QBC45DRAFT_441534 [Copromyces sp. CBS 386.78]